MSAGSTWGGGLSLSAAPIHPQMSKTLQVCYLVPQVLTALLLESRTLDVSRQVRSAIATQLSRRTLVLLSSQGQDQLAARTPFLLCHLSSGFVHAQTHTQSRPPTCPVCFAGGLCEAHARHRHGGRRHGAGAGPDVLAAPPSQVH